MGYMILAMMTAKQRVSVLKANAAEIISNIIDSS